ncbi:MAG: GNAT family N-acetyltransferase [Limosilactobacillus sp.]
MAEQVEIKLATADDAPAVLEFLRQAATETDAVLIPHLDQVSVEQERQNLETINRFADCVVMLAMLDNQPIGIVTVMVLGERPTAGELGVVVAKKYWRNGIGRLLVEEAEYWFENYSSLSSLVLSVFATNKPAIALYQRCHFVQTGTTTEAGKPALLMEYRR